MYDSQQIVSMAGDGKVLFWELGKAAATLHDAVHEEMYGQAESYTLSLKTMCVTRPPDTPPFLILYLLLLLRALFLVSI